MTKVPMQTFLQAGELSFPFPCSRLSVAIPHSWLVLPVLPGDDAHDLRDFQYCEAFRSKAGLPKTLTARVPQASRIRKQPCTSWQCAADTTASRPSRQKDLQVAAGEVSCRGPDHGGSGPTGKDRIRSRSCYLAGLSDWRPSLFDAPLFTNGSHPSSLGCDLFGFLGVGTSSHYQTPSGRHTAAIRTLRTAVAIRNITS